MASYLPSIKDNSLKAYLTVFRRNNLSKDFQFEKSYYDVNIDLKQLSDYKQLFNFKSDIPITFWFLIAQRAHLDLMIQRGFPLRIPGLIHAENEIKLHVEETTKEYLSVEIYCSVIKTDKKYHQVWFDVDVLRGDKKQVTVRTLYLSRNNDHNEKSQPTNRNNEFELEKNDFKKLESVWVSSEDIKRYAQISGDKNPIHTNKMIAKLFGFKGAIVHGWYLASLVQSKHELVSKVSVRSTKIHFLNPIMAISNFYIQKSKNWKLLSSSKICIRCTIS